MENVVMTVSAHHPVVSIILSGYRLGDTEAVSSQPLPETISNRESNSQQQTVSYLDDLHWNHSSYFI